MWKFLHVFRVRAAYAEDAESYHCERLHFFAEHFGLTRRTVAAFDPALGLQRVILRW